eukprot:TRINITY_DN13968_c0_g1_i1.p1 TRINITY_DN13968_c0_g1~~TRINITY_DN13968_c0_g1_i1.p1  ORF type:complete len:266 (+),score=32.40 TRINITY_DN13968_c0_g1_i1:63-860(+)
MEPLDEMLQRVERANSLAQSLSLGATFSGKISSGRGPQQPTAQLPADALPYTILVEVTVTTLRRTRRRKVLLYEDFLNKLEQLEGGLTSAFATTEPYCVGTAQVWLHSLANMVELTSDPPVLSHTGQLQGRLQVTLLPVDRHGTTGPWEDTYEDDPFVEDPGDPRLVDTVFHFEVVVGHLQLERGMDTFQAGSDGWFVCYRLWPYENAAWTSTPTAWPSLPECEELLVPLNHRFRHRARRTKGTIEHLKCSPAIFTIWAVPSGQS